MSGANIEELTAEARGMAMFKGADSATDVVLLLEMCPLPHRKSEAVQALEFLLLSHSGAARMNEAVRSCSGEVSGMEMRKTRAQMREAAPVREGEFARAAELKRAMKTQPFCFAPPITEPGDPDRHPWDGLVGVNPSFTDFSGGIGSMAACFADAGFEVVAVSAVGNRRRLVQQNAPRAVITGDWLSVDPVDVRWSHGIGIGCSPASQPFSRGGKQLAWADDRAYGVLKTLHLIAVVQPRWCHMEVAQAFETADGGRVWSLLQAVAKAVGFVARLRKD
jgi:hypothetical protein